ncbi:MAG: glycosyltransferase [Burkholderiales bacterium]|nr:glycosyltransferase [Burkholderiales bacterium]
MSSPIVDDGGVPLVHETVVPSSLQVSIVTWRPDLGLLDRCLRKLALAAGAARESGIVRTVNVALVDNSEDRATAAKVIELGRARFADSGVQTSFVHGHANIGYGAAHNLVLHGSGADFHLVLNPDVELAADAIANGVRWMNAHPDVGAIAPLVRRRDGTRDYLVKRKPAVLDLALRGFLPGLGRVLFRRRLDRYEMRDVVDPDPARDIVDIAAMSGACMLLRRKAVDQTGGFDPGFFLYFEDYDWTMRLNKVARTAYVPSFEIVHHGGGAGRKGARHIGHFVRGGWRYYRKHGWKWW